jgi:hypothetical protein
VLLTPVQAPNANAHAERWIRTVRAECLDWLLIVGRGHLEQVLRVYVQHYNAQWGVRSQSRGFSGGVISRAMVRRRVLSSRWRCWWSGRSSTWRCGASSS